MENDYLCRFIISQYIYLEIVRSYYIINYFNVVLLFYVQENVCCFAGDNYYNNNSVYYYYMTIADWPDRNVPFKRPPTNYQS